MFISVISIHVRNIETNRKIHFWFRETKPKKTRNRLSFGSFWFKSKIFFVCFDGVLVTPIIKNSVFFLSVGI